MSGLEPPARDDAAPGPPGRSPGEPYELDDLIRYQKRQTWLVAVLLLLAVLFTAGRGLLPGPAPDGPSGGDPAPLDSTR